MLNINKIIFVGETQFGTAFVKVRPHKTDPSKLALKSNLPECGAMLCMGLGIKAGNEWRGSTHFITEVDKAAFMAGLGQIATVMKAVETHESKALPAVGSCSECGCDGGTHWGFCPNHPENKAKVLN